MIAVTPHVKRLVITTLVVFGAGGVPAPARACDCAIPFNRKIAAPMLREAARIIVVGNVLWARQTEERPLEGGDPLVVAKVAVTRVVKGAVPDEVMIESAGGYSGGNCGMGSYLLRVVQEGTPIALVLDRTAASGRFTLTYCNQLRLDEVSAGPHDRRMGVDAVAQLASVMIGGLPCHASLM